ncbi:MAG: class I tRNA ligase family protein [Patescibacteria group bacterium UBA2163]
MSKSFYVTSPIYYPNAQPHLGHAYTTLLCDALIRYHKALGDDTYFLTGTDENSEKIVQAAEKLGRDPKEYLEENVQRFKDLYALLDIQYDQFIRTTDEVVHWPGAIEMWKRLEASGDLYKASYTGLYCVGHEAFLTDKELDENGVCPDHGVAPEEVVEENWFFKLSKYKDILADRINTGELSITPETRKNEVLSFLKTVEDVSFSRPASKMTWGVPVPGDETQKMYVWVDALSNYITALGFGRGEELMHFWPGVHILGKDILRFHAVFWPAMLISAQLPLPKEIFVHGSIISDGKKMSKTLGNVISPYEMVDRYGKDASRYLLLKHVHPFEDTDVTWERLDEWYMAYLSNGLGNLVARVMKMAETHLDMPVVEVTPVFSEAIKGEFENAMSGFEFNHALDVVWKRVGDLDAYIQEHQPYKVVKTDPDTAKEDIKYLVTELMGIAHLLEPFMPETTIKIKEAVTENRMPEALFPRLDT